MDDVNIPLGTKLIQLRADIMLGYHRDEALQELEYIANQIVLCPSTSNDLHQLSAPLFEIHKDNSDITSRIYANLSHTIDPMTRYYMDALFNIIDERFNVSDLEGTVYFVKSNIHLISKKYHPVFGVWISQYDPDLSYSILFGSLHHEDEQYNILLRKCEVVTFLCKNRVVPSNAFISMFPNNLEPVIIELKEQCLGKISEEILIHGYDTLIKYTDPQSDIDKIANEKLTNYQNLFFKICRKSNIQEITQEMWDYIKETDLVFQNHFKDCVDKRALTAEGKDINTIILHFPNSINAIPHDNLVNYLVDPDTNLSVEVLQIVIDITNDPFMFANIVAEWKKDFSLLPIPVQQKEQRIALTGTPFDEAIYNRLSEIPFTLFRSDFLYAPIPVSIKRTPYLMRFLAYMIVNNKIEIEFPYTPSDFASEDIDKIINFLAHEEKLKEFEIPPIISDCSAITYFQTIYKSAKMVKHNNILKMPFLKRLISIKLLLANSYNTPSLCDLLLDDPESEESSPFHDHYIRAAIKIINGTNIFSQNTRVLMAAKYMLYISNHSQFSDIISSVEFSLILRRLFDKRAMLSSVLSSNPNAILQLESKFIESIKLIHIKQEPLVFDLSILPNMLNHFKTETVKTNEIIFTAQNRKSFPKIVYKHEESLNKALKICQQPELQGEIIALAFRSRMNSVIDDFFRDNEIEDEHATIIKKLYANGYRSPYLIERVLEECLNGSDIFKEMLSMFIEQQDEAIIIVGNYLYQQISDDSSDCEDDDKPFKIFLNDLQQPSSTVMQICQLLVSYSSKNPYALEIIEQFASPLHYAFLENRNDVFELYSKLKNPIKFFVTLIEPYDVTIDFINWAVKELLEPDHDPSKQIIVDIFAVMFYTNYSHIFVFYFMKNGWERCINELEGVFNIDSFYCIFLYNNFYWTGESYVDFLQTVDPNFTLFRTSSLDDMNDEEKRAVLLSMAPNSFEDIPEDFISSKNVEDLQNMPIEDLTSIISDVMKYRATMTLFGLSYEVFKTLFRKALADTHKVPYRMERVIGELLDFSSIYYEYGSKAFIELTKENEYPIQNVIKIINMFQIHNQNGIPDFFEYIVDNFYDFYNAEMDYFITMPITSNILAPIQFRYSILTNILDHSYSTRKFEKYRKNVDIIRELVLNNTDEDITYAMMYYILCLPIEVAQELSPILLKHLDKMLYCLPFTNAEKSKEEEAIKLLNILCPLREQSGPIAGMGTEFINESFVTVEFFRIPKLWLETSPYWQIVYKHRGKVLSLMKASKMTMNIITYYPELLSFKAKHYFFLKYSKKDDEHSTVKIKIHREKVFEDTMCMKEQIYKPYVCVKFRGEKGFDGGGLTREWITLFFDEVEKRKMFIQNEFGESLPSERFTEDEFEVLGIVVATAFINGVIIPFRFSVPQYKRFIQKEFTIRDIRTIDLQLFSSLEYILQNDPEDLGITFSANINGKEIELIQNGLQIPVTQLNKDEYVNRYIEEFFNNSRMAAISRGFEKMMIALTSTVQIFTPWELMRAMSGVTAIDTEMLIRNVKYINPFDENTPVVQMFFEVIRGFSSDEMTDLLFFITGMRRVPTIRLSIILAPGGDPPRLPTAHTCHEVLKLPNYTHIDELSRSLRMAIMSCKSFEII